MTLEEELTQYCSDLTCPQYSNCDLCMYKKGIDDCIKLIKSHSDDDKMMNDWYVELLEEFKEKIDE